ncbi:hypothetical protein OPAG_06764 [Rhodococcus opacus PD630]|nr:hypothetical protein OPAG_06764 [Rhodococcus opacus PD630]
MGGSQAGGRRSERPSAHQWPVLVEIHQLPHVLRFRQLGHLLKLGQFGGAGRREVEAHHLCDPLPDVLMNHARSPCLSNSRHAFTLVGTRNAPVSTVNRADPGAHRRSRDPGRGRRLHAVHTPGLVSEPVSRSASRSSRD